ncbi:IclR family transcriptional regulator [Levilactobacillus bambusae]|uniref:IclR family transcriptional regulator n=1 Tax=Levilactobacillus bambusae TaxID=2024736 RepID=A0A2V1MY96_9LACO|nr:IclR family transcriptional regulator [Levilactobacillus bambusae]PWF99948.1 IclR family transcriptional regulator [Levilactobacillus bambusae]
MDETTKKPYGTVLIRAKMIMDFLLGFNGTPTLKEISDGVKMSKPTTLKILVTMEELGLVTRTEGSKQYALGLSLLAFGQKAADSFNIGSLAAPVLERLRNETNETINLGVADQNMVVLLDKFESPRSVSLKSRIGGKMNLYSSSMGKAILSTWSAGQLSDYLQQTELKKIAPNTITTAVGLAEDLETIRSRGYAIDDEENEQDIYCVGFPLVAYGRVQGAFSVTAPKFRMDPDRRKKIIELAKRAQTQVEKAF